MLNIYIVLVNSRIPDFVDFCTVSLTVINVNYIVYLSNVEFNLIRIVKRSFKFTYDCMTFADELFNSVIVLKM